MKVTDELPNFAPISILVTFKDGVEPQRIEKILGDFEYRQAIPQARSDSHSKNERLLSLTYRVKVPAGNEEEVVRELRVNYAEYIESVSRNPMIYIQTTT